MTWTKLLCQPIAVAFTVTCALLSFATSVLGLPPQLSNPLNYEPPDDGRAPPKDTKTGIDRPGCPIVNKPLTTLVPKYYIGLTIAQKPTFWVYVPYSATSQQSAKFVLWDEQQTKVYETTIQLKDTPGIISISLPETAPSLALEKIYKWEFIFKCGEFGEDSDYGWVKPVTLPDLQSQLQTATTPRERIFIYADQGLWHEALTELAQLRRIQPQDETIKLDWDNLLSDPDVRLEQIISEPIVSCCTVED